MKNAKKSEKTVTVRVTPRASKSMVVGWEEDVLRVRLKANPEKGQANEELIELLSEFFGLPKSKIQLVRGHKSRLKKILLIDHHFFSSKEPLKE